MALNRAASREDAADVPSACIDLGFVDKDMARLNTSFVPSA